ncbi:MAG: hypothetical protein U1E78_01375 [Gammaproteobacteria bacterium]|jgi:serine/threonine protein kinase
MISYTSQNAGQKKQYSKGRILGEGAIGEVFELCDEDGNETSFVCKSVKLRDDSGFSKRFILKGTINEIRILKKLGLFEGYCRQGENFYVVMSKVEGVTEQVSRNPKKEWYSYRALRALHRQNIAHMDAHTGNILVGDHEAKVIDFNFASEGTYFNCGIDNIGFFIERNKSFKDLVGWYICDTLQYISEHKFETASNLLLMGALTLSGIYGIPPLYVTNVMMWELFWVMAKVQIAKEITSSGLMFLARELSFWVLEDSISDADWKKISPVLSGIFETLQSCFSIYFLYSDIAYGTMNNADALKNTMNNFRDTAWGDLFCQSTVEALHQASLIYLPLRQLITTSCDYIENQVLPKFALKAEADLLFSFSPKLYGTAKSFVFSQNPESRVHPKPSVV